MQELRIKREFFAYLNLEFFFNYQTAKKSNSIHFLFERAATSINPLAFDYFLITLSLRTLSSKAGGHIRVPVQIFFRHKRHTK